MKLSNKILKKLDEGTLNAISFDDELPDVDDVKMRKINNDAEAANRISKLTLMANLAKAMQLLSEYNYCYPMPDTITELSRMHYEEGFLFDINQIPSEEYGDDADDKLRSLIFGCCSSVFKNRLVDLNWIDTSSVTDMTGLFRNVMANNINISDWDVSNVKSMWGMFNGCSNFNGNISKWDVSNVINMRSMFNGCINFNGDISKWDVSNVTDMSYMFNDTNMFNLDISNWNLGKLELANGMFANAKGFNLDLSKWKFGPNLLQVDGIFEKSGMEAKNIPPRIIELFILKK